MTKRWVKYSVLVQLAVAGVAIAAEEIDVPPMKDSAAQTGDMKQAPAGILRASKLIGADVYSRQDKELGSIKDIVLDQNDRRVGYVVLSHGSTLGMGGKLCAVPFAYIQTSPFDPNAKLHARFDEQTLKDAPAFSGDQWPTQANSQYFQKANEYYSSHVTGDEAVTAAKGSMNDLNDQAKTAMKDTDQAGQAIPAGAKIDKTGLQWTRRVSELMDARVESPTGDKLGEVKDLVLDGRSGDVRYVVLSFGGIMGMGDKLFAVPINQFKIQPKGNVLELNVDKASLKNAPGFDKDHWPTMTDADWDKNITQFYQQNGTNRDATPNP